MWPLLAILLGALGLLYAWWPLRRTGEAPPLLDEGAAVTDPVIAREAFDAARRWSIAAGEVRSAAAGEERTVGAGKDGPPRADPLEPTDARPMDRDAADRVGEERSQREGEET